MTLAILLAICSFAGLFLIFLFMLRRPSAQSTLLDQVTNAVRDEREGRAQAWHSAVNADVVAKPFTFFRHLFSSELNPDLVRRLLLAGYRKPAHADIFLGARLALPALLGFLVLVLVGSNTIFLFLLTIVLAFFIPDFWLNYAVKKRRERIRLSLPDGLDLLSICLEAGLGLDQGIVRVGQELEVSHPELSEELLLINFEQRAGVQRNAAWQSFAVRAGFESARSFVAMLIQTDRFGTPIAKSLGAFSDALRTQRRQQAEERAAKTTIKLVPPLVFCNFPAMGVVVIGPALVAISYFFAHFLHS